MLSCCCVCEQCILAATRLREDFSFHLTDDGKLMAIDFVTPYVSQAACAEYQKVDFVLVSWRCINMLIRVFVMMSSAG